MQLNIKGHELSKVHDMKKLPIFLAQCLVEELQEGVEEKRKIQITTSNALIIADKLNTEEPNENKMTLLDKAILKSEDTMFPLINEGSVTNFYGMLVLSNVKIVPFANPDNIIEYESYALYTDHIMGFGLTE
jgi:predicted nucleic acid-binding protein